MLVGRLGCMTWIIGWVMIRRGRGTAMRHRGRKLAGVEAHGSARRINAGTIGIPLGHDDCLIRNNKFQGDCCSVISGAWLCEDSQCWRNRVYLEYIKLNQNLRIDKWWKKNANAKTGGT